MAYAGAKLTAGLGALALGMAGVAGCGGGGGAGRQTAEQTGGTLKVIGSSDVEHLDTASANSVGAYTLNRTYTRTLFGTKASNNFEETLPIQADLAAKVPSRENDGISKDGKTYTVKLRDGVRWNTQPPRPVVAADFVRALKRLCNPASPSGGKGYYTSTIRGMDSFCRGFADVDAKSAKAIAAYQDKHSISGVKAPDDRTLVFKLTRRASDFLNILALQFAAAAPKEYDAYVPDSPEFRKHTVSNGPYQITSYAPGRSYTLTASPTWRQENDPLRSQHVEKIQITLGQDSPDAVQQQLEQGTADLAWDQPVPTSAIPRLRTATRGKPDSPFAIRDTPSNSPYLVFNTLSPSNGGALAKREVRQAIQFAVDRTALIKIYGGPEVAQPLHTVIPPGNSGYGEYNLYPTPGDAGDPVRCRDMLTHAGYPRGLTLKFPFRTNSNHKRVAESLKENLRDCGIKTTLKADTNGGFYGETLVTPAKARQGAWDIAAPGWTPDWYGNNGRSTIAPLFDGRTYGQNSPNYGGYSNPLVNKLIDNALTAPDAEKAAGYWHQADRFIMTDAAIVPLIDRAFMIYQSKRVRNARFVPASSSYDYTQLWLATG